MAGDLAVDLGLRHLRMADEVSGAGGDETRGRDAIRRTGTQYVASHLLSDELPIGLVGVERANDVIAVGPGHGPGLVLVVAVSLSIVDDIKPVPGPALAVRGAGQQPVNELLVGVGSGIGDEGVDLL